MTTEISWQQRFHNFENAFNTLTRIMLRYDSQPDDEVVQMALVQAFEISYELAWNCMKDYLENEGFVEISNPKQTIRTAFQAKLILDAEAWMLAIKKRNLASYSYNQVILEETVFYITEEFYPLASKLYSDLKGQL